MRQFLRFEQLLAQYHDGLERTSAAGSHEALVTLCDIYQLTIHVDLKAEVLREIERLGKAITDDPLLIEQLDALKESIKDVNGIRGQLGGHLKNHHFFNLVRQRITMPGGMNPFDLPISHHWLNQPHEQRKQDLHAWIAPYVQLNSAIGQILKTTRNSATQESQTAEEGFFQKSFMGSREIQLIQILTPTNVCYYPEVSSGRQRISIRFFQIKDLEERSGQIDDDIEFEFLYCL